MGVTADDIRRAEASAVGASHCLSPKKGKGCVESISLGLINAMKGDLILVKAVAMAIYVKNRMRDSRVKDYSLNGLRKIVHLHHNTVRKYTDKLYTWGLVRMEGNDMVFTSLSERHGRPKVSIGSTAGLTIKQIENQLLAAQVVLIVKRKEYAKRTIATATNPGRRKDDYDDFKRARKARMKYGYADVFHDYGLSYKTIARRLGIGLQKAEEVVRYAIAHGLLVKHRRQEQHRVGGIGFAAKYVDEGGSNMTFSTKDNVYIILANVYSLPTYPTGNN